jgi:transcriptional activator SPT7
MADDQVGLLKPYYQHRFAMLATAQGGSPLPSHPLPGPPPASFPPTPLPGLLLVNHGPSPPSAIPTVRPDLILPDDVPNPAQLRISPIGQIIKTGASAGKKKALTKTISTGGQVGTPGSGAPAGLESAATRKKKGNTGVGSGNGRKKKPDSVPPPVFGNQGNLVLPAVVIASA